MPNRLALDARLALFLGGTLALLLVVFSLFTIRQIESLSDDNLRTQITAAETRLATSLPPQVWNFDTAQIRSTLNAELYADAIFKIVVDSPGMAPIVVSKGDARAVKTSPFRSRLSYYDNLEKRIVPIGSLTIYSNDSLSSGRVAALRSFIATWLTSIVLFMAIVSYLAIRLALVEPKIQRKLLIGESRL